MPIYEYQCAQCQQVTEAIQKFSDTPLSECPRCGGPLTKLMSMNSFQLKGGGWYVTDYGKKNGGASPSKGESHSQGDGAADKGAAKPSDSPASKPAKEPQAKA